MHSGPMTEDFLPPVNRAMRELDRTFFQRSFILAAASISDLKQFSEIRRALTKTNEILLLGDGALTIRVDAESPGAKEMLLIPSVNPADASTWSTDLKALESSGSIKVKSSRLDMTYDYWSMSQILDAILPEGVEDDKEHPTGFTQVGHVAHLNLRSAYLPYKHLIAQVLADKNRAIKTVINKTEDVGTGSAYRTFPYEVLMGPDDLNVVVHEGDCEFRFDFGKVYWNSRLETEHRRIIHKFEPGQAVCDVMAGVGPFALPAGKRKVFVRANDLNPAAHASLENNIRLNKVDPFVQASSKDGREFIRNETSVLMFAQRTYQPPPPKASRSLRISIAKGEATAPPAPPPMPEPMLFDHYVMNLPGSAVEFLDAFRGIYHGCDFIFSGRNSVDGRPKMPMIHVYTFQVKCATSLEEQQAVCAKVSHHLGAEIRVDDADAEIYKVRLVSPSKWMYCASFRLPEDVAFARP